MQSHSSRSWPADIFTVVSSLSSLDGRLLRSGKISNNFSYVSLAMIGFLKNDPAVPISLIDGSFDSLMAMIAFAISRGVRFCFFSNDSFTFP